MEHFAAARDILRLESDRLSNVFSAFLLANTVFIGFLLHAATGNGGFPGEPGIAMVGGLVGLCVSGLWLAAYERNAAAVDMRMARPRDGTGRLGAPDRATALIRPGPGGDVRR